MVIENDEAILEIVSTILAEEGYEVNALHTPRFFFNEIERYQPDAILLDIVEPSPVGTEICHALKKNIKTKHIPVIVFFTHPKVMQTIKNVCADEFVPKPFDIDALIKAVEMQLD
jgi:DNA-binding response OmpR family regulator